MSHKYKGTHTREELVGKIEDLQRELDRLRAKPSQADEVKFWQEFTAQLSEELRLVVEANKAYWNMLKPRLEQEGILPKEGEKDEYWEKRAAARSAGGRQPAEA